MKIVYDNQALRFKVKSVDVNKILTKIEKSVVVEDNGVEADILMAWNINDMHTLTDMFGHLSLPSPITTEYEWPGMYTPFKHQITTAEFLSLRRRAFCFNEAGTGKSASVIWAADYLMNKGIIKRVLIVCPLSIMYSAWLADIFKTAMHRSAAVAYGANSKRIKIVSGEYEFVIINFDGLSTVGDELKKAKFDLIVADECFVAGTRIKTPKGLVPIELLNIGDKVLTSSGAQHIKSLVCKTSSSIITLRLSDGKQITCTANHPFFTDIGWVTAENLVGRRLISENELSNMRRGLYLSEETASMAKNQKYSGWYDLLSILRTEEIPQVKPGKILFPDNAPRTKRKIHGDSKIRRVSDANVRTPQENWAQTNNTWWKWNRDDSNGKINTRGVTGKMGVELRGIVGEEAARLSIMLQTRLCKSSFKNWIRSGWKLPRYESKERTRPEESFKTEGAWVVSVTHNKQRRGETVYNLEIAGTPNYFAEGYLVHNCSAFKTASTKRWKSLAKLLMPSTRLWMLTGTPASQSPIDAFGLAKLVSPDNVPKYFNAWRDKVMYRVTQFKWNPKETALTDVYNALQPAIRFTKDECLDLPDVIYQTREVPLTPQVLKYYKELKSQMLIEAAGEEISAVNAASKLTKLLQLSGGAVYTDTHEIVEFDVSPRLKELKSIINEASHKVLVFVPYSHTIELVSNYLTSKGVTNDIIAGDVSANNRRSIIDRFQTDDSIQVLIIQPQAGAHGITLTAANIAVFWSPVMSVEIYLQCIARVDRLGQKNKMFVINLQGSEAERKMYEMLQGKITQHGALVELYKNEIGL